MSPERYRYLRRQIGTQKEVAALLGVQQAVISKRERGMAPISQEIALAIRQLRLQERGNSPTLPIIALPPVNRAAEKARERRQDRKAVEHGLAAAVQRRNSRFSKSRGGRRLVIPNLEEALAN